MAMKIGGVYRLRNIAIANWKKLAAEVRIDSDQLISRIAELVASLPDYASTISKRVESEGLSHALIAKLTHQLQSRARQCRSQLEIAGTVAESAIG
jgi:hypothetical protein